MILCVKRLMKDVPALHIVVLHFAPKTCDDLHCALAKRVRRVIAPEVGHKL